MNGNEKPGEKEITPEEVNHVFIEKYGSNFKYSVSFLKNLLDPNKLVNSVNKRCSRLTNQERESFISFCNNYGSRIPVHLFRMLHDERLEVEKTFALVFMESFTAIKDALKQRDDNYYLSMSDNEEVDFYKDRLIDNLGNESVDSGFFWTFAPYLYKHLNGQPIDRLRKIIKWALVINTKKSELKEEKANKTIHLDGIINESNFDLQTYYLSEQEDVTHQFTDQEAKRMIRENPEFWQSDDFSWD